MYFTSFFLYFIVKHSLSARKCSSKKHSRVEKVVRGKCHLSCGVDLVGCVHSALQRGGMDGGTAAERPAGGMGGTGCPESGGSLPEGRTREANQILKKRNEHKNGQWAFF